MTQRIEPVDPRRDLAPAERVPLLGKVERERREQRRRERSRKPSEPRRSGESGGSLDVRA